MTYFDYAQSYPMTPKMYMALEVIANRDNDCEPQTLDSILAQLPYAPTKQAFQFTLRSMIKRGWVEKLNRKCVDGKSRRMLRITVMGLHKLSSEKFIAMKAADSKTCLVDEIERTDKLIAKIKAEFGE